MNKKFVVYTCITGGYDILHEVKFVSPDIDYICFTDNANLHSKTWQIRQLPEDLSEVKSLVKKQRLIKILPHKYLSEYDVSLWVDSNIEIIGDIRDFFSKYDLSNKFLYVNRHPSRDCIYREQLAIIRLGRDTFENTNEQINRYRDEGYPEHYGLAETNILLRKHSDKRCIRLMEAWAAEIKKGSHRDQLSFNYCLWKCDLKDYVEYLNEKYYNLHFSDNAFFILKQHMKDSNYKQIVVVKDPSKQITIDTNEDDKKEIVPSTASTSTSTSTSTAQILIPHIKKVEKPVEVSNELPVVPVVVFTHDRTTVAVETIKSLFKNLKYQKLSWIVVDDRSMPEHIKSIQDVFAENKVDFELLHTSKNRFGLGAAMNIGLKKCFEKSPIALRVEDDWILERPLDLRSHVEVLIKNPNAYAVRLGMVGGGVNYDSRLIKDNGYKAIIGPDINSWLFVNQVALVHKRAHDALGWYLENVSADRSESEFKERFNKASANGRSKLVLVPSTMKWRTFDDPSLWFIHIGRSTLGHVVYREPKRYSWIYNSSLQSRGIMKEKEQKNVFFKVIVPTYNVERYLKRCIESIETQSFKNFSVIVVDDISTDRTRNVMLELQKRYSNVHTIFLNKKKYGGGARNAGISFEGVKSQYTIFIDADDYLITNDAFKIIHDAIRKNSSPDCVSISYERDYGTIKNKKIYAIEGKPSDILRNRKFAPWLKVIKTEKIQTFLENRSCANDVVWTFRQMECVKTIVSVKTPLLHYTTDNKNSYWNGEQRHDQKSKDAIQMLRQDLSIECYKNKDIEEYRKKEIALIDNAKPPYTFMSDKELFCSIVIPCYNVEQYIADCLDSVLGQETKYNFEIICVNDGSTDKTKEIIESYQKNTKRIVLINQSNSGLSAARNAGIANAKGKYLVFLDSDDKLTKNAVNFIVSSMLKNKLDLLYFSGRVFYEQNVSKKLYPDSFYYRESTNGVLSGEQMYWRFRHANKLVLTACMQAIDRSYLSKTKVLFKPDMIYEDNLYTMQTMLLASRTLSVKDILYERRVRQNSLITSSKSYKYVRSNLLIVKEIQKFVKECPKVSTKTKEDIFQSLIKTLVLVFRNGNSELIKKAPTLKNEDKYGDFATIMDYLKIYSLETFSRQQFEQILKIV